VGVERKTLQVSSAHLNEQKNSPSTDIQKPMIAEI
jgi:hypothetical protein